jgi:hypothetical protein
MKVDVRATPSAAQEPRAGAERDAGPKRVAVLVCHGMGQQVPFETLDDLAREVAAVCVAEGTPPSVTVEQVMSEVEELIPRAELRFTPRSVAGGEQPVVAHFYEAYWAPLTEGKINLPQTLAFLAGAGWRGLGFATRDGVFDRWMFGGRQEFKIRSRAILQLFLAWSAVMALSLAFVAWSVLGIAVVASILDFSWPEPRDLATIVAADGGIVAYLLLMALIGLLVSRVLGKSPGPVESTQSLDRRALTPSGFLRGAAAAGAVAIAIVAIAGAVLVTLPVRDGLLASSAGLAWATAAAVLVGAGLVKLGWLLVQFPGDVAIYVSSYKVSRFQETRAAIQEVGRKISRFIYSLEPAYDEVLVVGHSLGSVIAYDTLDDAINRDLHAGGWYEGSAPGLFRVVERTPLLLTFGSPLDKTAFIFRTQQSRDDFEIREALAATMQPLIVSPDYAYRPKHWINIWSRWDWVSGSLDYYDRPASSDPRHVLNVEARGSMLPAGAHTGYWTAPLVRGVVYAMLAGALPADVTERAVATRADLDRLRGATANP